MTQDFETTDLAAALTYAGKFGTSGKPEGTDGALGFHQGVVDAWDSITGANTVRVLGTTINDLPVLSTADSIMLTEGDLVGVMRFQATYFILGRIAPPGGGAALSTRQAFDGSTVSTSNSTYTDLGGPSTTDVYVGSSRRVMVFFSAQITAGNAYGHASIAVSGASSIAAGQGGTPATVGGFDLADTGSGGDVFIGVTATAVQVFDSSVGLNEGLNTFTMMYRQEVPSGYTPTDSTSFLRRRIVVLPI